MLRKDARDVVSVGRLRLQETSAQLGDSREQLAIEEERLVLRPLQGQIEHEWVVLVPDYDVLFRREVPKERPPGLRADRLFTCVRFFHRRGMTCRLAPADGTPEPTG
jgi:hypothetical protein